MIVWITNNQYLNLVNIFKITEPESSGYGKKKLLVYNKNEVKLVDNCSVLSSDPMYYKLVRSSLSLS